MFSPVDRLPAGQHLSPKASSIEHESRESVRVKKVWLTLARRRRHCKNVYHPRQESIVQEPPETSHLSMIEALENSTSGY